MDFSRLPDDLWMHIVKFYPTKLRLRCRELKDLTDAAAATELHRASALFAETQKRVQDKNDLMVMANCDAHELKEGSPNYDPLLYTEAVKTFDLRADLLVEESLVFAEQLEAVYQDWGWHPLLGGLVGTHTLNLCSKILGYQLVNVRFWAMPNGGNLVSSKYAKSNLYLILTKSTWFKFQKLVKLRDRIMNRFGSLLPPDFYTKEKARILEMLRPLTVARLKSMLAAEGLAVGGRKPELLARAAALIVDRLSVAERRRAERRKAERRRPEVMWSRVYNALLADMLAKNQAWAFKNLLPHRIEDNDLEWWE